MLTHNSLRIYRQGRQNLWGLKHYTICCSPLLSHPSRNFKQYTRSYFLPRNQCNLVVLSVRLTLRIEHARPVLCLKGGLCIDIDLHHQVLSLLLHGVSGDARRIKETSKKLRGKRALLLEHILTRIHCPYRNIKTSTSKHQQCPHINQHNISLISKSSPFRYHWGTTVPAPVLS